VSAVSPTRPLGGTGLEVNPIGIGTWSMGGSWGTVDDTASTEALRVAVAGGADFFDTADNYGDGRSERLLGTVLASLQVPVVVATKMGRRASAPEYTLESFRRWVGASRERLGVDSIDLMQLHCPPPEIYSNPAVFEALDRLVAEGAIRHYGVSVQTIDQGMRCLDYPGVETLQVVFNIFRQRPAERLLSAARERGVGVIARIPLASGLLTGELRSDTAFAADDHRSFNREGEAFDVGETFAGVDYEVGLSAVEELRRWVPAGMTMAQFALRWILMFDAVSVAIVGASKPRHVEEALAVRSMPPLPSEVMDAVGALYAERIDPVIGSRWG